ASKGVDASATADFITDTFSSAIRSPFYNASQQKDPEQACGRSGLTWSARRTDPRARQRFSTIRAANSDVETRVEPGNCLARSYVTVPDWIARSSPRTTRSAASFQPRCSSIITPDRISEPGFTMSLPAYLGAVPCVASNT